jgi:hypothetical protein
LRIPSSTSLSCRSSINKQRYRDKWTSD